MSRPSRRDFLRALGCGAGALAARRLAHGAPAATRKPNIVFFLADDMGWMDSTVYGSRYYETPNMERLAKQGMVFTDAYAANPLCSPTRASILTGKYPARLKITTPPGHLPPLPNVPLLAEKGPPASRIIMPRSRRFLPPDEFTIAEALEDAGYRTGFVGKWHLGLRPEHWPEEQGFELSFHGAPDPGPRSYFSPYQFPAGTVTAGPKGEYITDRVTDEGLKFIEKHRREPFLLCLWHYAVHGPWGHKEAITKTFVGKKDPRGKQGNPIMASMLKSLDESLGRVMDKLDELGLAGNTVLIFFSDNGGNIHRNTEADVKARRLRPGHPRWAVIADWRKYAGTQAPTNNAPLRGGKAHIYEGGTREPCIIRWPGVVKPGSSTSEIISSIDFYPTLLEIAGAKPRPAQILDGVSILPVLKGGKLGREAIFCHFPHGLGKLNYPSTYVRRGHWKLIRFYHRCDDGSHDYELYHLKDDIGETTNLAAKMPAKVEELDALIERFLKDTGALVPVRNPAYDPALRPIAGWRPSRHGKLSLQDGALRVEATGGDPFIQTGAVPTFEGKAVIKMRMKSDSKGAGQFFWASGRQRRFGPQQRLNFAPQHDGRWHEYAIPFEVKGVLWSIRIDPATAPGVIEFDWIRLCTPAGKVLARWEFD